MLFFNTVKNKSSDWGVSPFHWYFTKALPKSLLGGFFLLFLGVLKIRLKQRRQKSPKKGRFALFAFGLEVAINGRIFEQFLPALSFVALYSFLPHKELRFIMPALPIFNVVASEGLASICELVLQARLGSGEGSKGTYADNGSDSKPKDDSRLRRRRSATSVSTSTNSEAAQRVRVGTSSITNTTKAIIFAFALGGLALVALSFAGTAIFLASSHHNYPGGLALSKLHRHYDDAMGECETCKVVVFIDNAAAMTGINRFGEIGGENWSYVKDGYESENLRRVSEQSSSFTHIITEISEPRPGFRLVDSVKGFKRFDFSRLRVELEDKLFIYERRSSQSS